MPYNATSESKTQAVKRLVIVAHLNYSVICDKSWYSGADGSVAAGQLRALRMWIYSRFMLTYT